MALLDEVLEMIGGEDQPPAEPKEETPAPPAEPKAGKQDVTWSKQWEEIYGPVKKNS